MVEIHGEHVDVHCNNLYVTVLFNQDLMLQEENITFKQLLIPNVSILFARHFTLSVYLCMSSPESIGNQ